MNEPLPAKIERAGPADLTPMQMLQIAVQRGVDTEQLARLMDLNERWLAAQARNAFTTAMAAFKAEPITILKTKWVDIPGGAKFAHATIADVVDGAVAALSKHGFSHRWETTQDGASGLISVTCILTHRDGHSETARLMGSPDDSGKKNSIQQAASTVTYLERYTLLAVTGLAARDMPDRDDQAAVKTEPAPEGYDSWRADMTAVADEGMANLTAAWEKSKPVYRRHVVKFDEPWWRDQKAKAAKVKV